MGWVRAAEAGCEEGVLELCVHICSGTAVLAYESDRDRLWVLRFLA